MNDGFFARLLRHLGHPDEAEQVTELLALQGRRSRLRDRLRATQNTVTATEIKAELGEIEAKIKALETALVGDE